MEEDLNLESQRLYDLLQAVNAKLYPGSSLSQLAVRGYNQMMELLKEALPEDNIVLDSYYQTKKLGDDEDLTSCKFCGYERYKHRVGSHKRKLVPYKKIYYFPLIPILRRLDASHATDVDMRWHHENIQEEGAMRHLSDSEAWKHFNETHSVFAAEPRNVRLGLCTDGFQPFAQPGRKYSSWPVIVTPYNFPPRMFTKEAYMFLTVIVPGPDNPKQKIDVYLQPLIKELTLLWETSVEAFDISKKENFQLRAALMWTINDFPAYSMLSGWSTGGNLACPYCMEETQSFRLKHGGKTTWFDSHSIFLDQNHPFRRDRKNFLKGHIVTRPPPTVRTGEKILNQTCELGIRKVTELDAREVNKRICNSYGWKKRSIFWDLSYWSSNMIRHNLDVMHIEKNVFDNVFNTVLNVVGKTKDNPKAHLDIAKYCDRPQLARNPDGSYPKAAYTIEKNKKIVLFDWLEGVKFPDGYVSNMSRCLDTDKFKLFGMKIHDCHVFMQRLLPIAFRELLPSNVWRAITELSLFFNDLTSTVLQVVDLERLEVHIPQILCKLERLFPLGFFNSMEHLPMYLPYEARIAGPVQYR
ncbi:uncharacterized protein LOC132637807 [Lycium barbarum]|uniref:uncharacterized protein LOC132637807 n=1 Tax=Lycium barbarum TaxID=112863 RepID=UPI00293E3B6A|nr:uncharacterized protein LOC132637807 [Lycium barbarum]